MKKFFIILVILIGSYFTIVYNIQNNTKLYFFSKQYIPKDLKRIIRSTFTKINTLYVYNSSSFVFKEKRGIKLDSLKDNRVMSVYTNSNLIWTGPRAYFTSDKNNLFLITGTGILMHVNKEDINISSNKIKFKTISTNFDEILINYKEDKKFYSFTSMVKSILYKKDSLYVALVQKVGKDCFTHIIYKGDVNLNSIKFKEFFKFERCKPFYTDYLGGSLADFKENKILITIGDWTVCEDYRWVDNNPKGFCTENGAQSLYLYVEAPLYKSHKDYGFEEPVDYFVPSIGISDVVKYKDKLLVASMGAEIEQGDLSLYVYSLDSELNLSNKKINKVYQRIRDIHVFNGYTFLFLESTGSIGVFPIKNL